MQLFGSVNNAATWEMLSDNALEPIYIPSTPSYIPTFTNSGVFEKNGGGGFTNVSMAFINQGGLIENNTGNINFSWSFTDNNGTVNAQTGTINFSGGNALFNGTNFTGAGVNIISSNASFGYGGVGAGTTNLELTGGTFTGSSYYYGPSQLNGKIEWIGGQFAGQFQNNATINVQTGGQTGIANNAYFVNNTTGVFNFATGTTLTLGTGDYFTNQGVIDLAVGANIAIGDSSNLSNSGTVKIEGDGTVLTASNHQTGATLGAYTENTGTFSKVGGTGVTNIGSAQFTDNNGTVNAQTGTINFSGGNALFNGTNFTGAGVNIISSNASFGYGGVGAGTTNLELTGGTFTESSYYGYSSLNGTIAWLGGKFSGNFQNNGAINVQSETQLGLATNAYFDNKGVINAQGTINTLGANFTNDGTLTEGNSINSLTFAGNYNQSSSGTLKLEINNFSNYDQFIVTGNASFAGSLELYCSSCSLKVGQVLDLVTVDGVWSGNLTTKLLGFNPAYTFSEKEVNNVLTLTVLTAPTVVPEPEQWAMLLLGLPVISAFSKRKQA